MIGLLNRIGNDFNFGNIEGIIFWGNGQNVIESGGLVSQVDDLSGSGNDLTQIIESQKPSIAAEQLNGFDVLENDGNDRVFDISLSGGTETIISVIIVMNNDNNWSEDERLAGFRSTSPNYIVQIGTEGNIGLGVGLSNDSVNLVDFGASGWNVLKAVFVQGGTSKIGKNFEDMVNTTISANDNNSVSMVGATGIPPLSWQGLQAEMLVYNRELSSAEFDLIVSQLKSKYEF